MNDLLFYEITDTKKGLKKRVELLWKKANTTRKIVLVLYCLSALLMVLSAIFTVALKMSLFYLMTPCFALLQVIFAYLSSELKWLGVNKRRKHNDQWTRYNSRLNDIEQILKQRGLYNKQMIEHLIDGLNVSIIRYNEKRKNYLIPGSVLIEKMVFPLAAFAAGTFVTYYADNTLLTGMLLNGLRIGVLLCLLLWTIAVLFRDFELTIFVEPRQELIENLKDIVALRFASDGTPKECFTLSCKVYNSEGEK